jgi:hypothetical protein
MMEDCLVDAVNVDEGEERYAVVDVEKIAQGYDDDCTWILKPVD